MKGNGLLLPAISLLVTLLILAGLAPVFDIGITSILDGVGSTGINAALVKLIFPVLIVSILMSLIWKYQRQNVYGM